MISRLPRDLARLYEKIVSDVISARDYGAVGDGQTDDWPAFDAALNDCRACNQRALYVPRGFYALSRTLNISNVSVIGAGAVATTFRALGGFEGESVLRLDASTGGGGSIDSMIQNFRIDANMTMNRPPIHGIAIVGCVLYTMFDTIRINEAKGSGVVLDVDSTGRPSLLGFRNVHVNGGKSHGFEVRGARNFRFELCAAENLDGHGFYLSGSSEPVWRGTIDEPWVERVAGDGFHINGYGITVNHPHVNGYGNDDEVCAGIRWTGTANSSGNKLVGGDFARNQGSHPASRHVIVDGGGRLILENLEMPPEEIETPSGTIIRV